jgi:hypothetical protein
LSFIKRMLASFLRSTLETSKVIFGNISCAKMLHFVSDEIDKSVQGNLHVCYNDSTKLVLMVSMWKFFQGSLESLYRYQFNSKLNWIYLGCLDWLFLSLGNRHWQYFLHWLQNILLRIDAKTQELHWKNVSFCQNNYVDR